MEKAGINLLTKIKNAQLYGEDAHSIYSPPYRPILSYEDIMAKKPRLAAVNILLYYKDDQWYIPLILRTTHERDKHSGQISFPGGSKDASDRDFAETAIRETMEEVGIERHYIRIIKEMSPLYIPPSNFYVKPFISYTKRNPKFILQESEVVELIEFPVSEIIALSNKPYTKVLPTSRKVEVPVIEFENYHIWGATSMILFEFSQLLNNM